MTDNALVTTSSSVPTLDDPQAKVAALIAQFLSGRSESTLRAYRRDLERFRAFVGAETLDEAAQLLLSRGHGEANALALSYKAYLIDRGLQATTVNRYIAALRSLVKMARTLGMVPWALEVPGGKVTPYRDTSGPGVQAVRAMLDVLNGETTPKAVRDRAMLRLLYDLGLRRAEVVSLDVEDIDLEGQALKVMRKGRTQAERLTLPERTLAALKAWLAVRGIEPGPLFVNYDRAGKGERLTGTGLYLMIRDLGRKAGLSVAVWPHGLRHTAITAALDESNGNLRDVQKFSGHRNLETLQLYDDNREDAAGRIAELVAGTL